MWAPPDSAPFHCYSTQRGGIHIIQQAQRHHQHHLHHTNDTTTTTTTTTDHSHQCPSLPSYLHRLSSDEHPLPPVPLAPLHRYLQLLVTRGPVVASSSLVRDEILSAPSSLAHYVSGNATELQQCRSSTLAAFWASLFYYIQCFSPATVELANWDLYHAHLFACVLPSLPADASLATSQPGCTVDLTHVECELGLLFHAKEFPLEFRTRRTKVYPIGAAEMGGERDPRRGTQCSTADHDFPYRNYLWLLSTNQLYLFDTLDPSCPPALGCCNTEFLTVDERFFMPRTVGSINLFPSSTEMLAGGHPLPPDRWKQWRRIRDAKRQWKLSLLRAESDADSREQYLMCDAPPLRPDLPPRRYYRLAPLLESWREACASAQPPIASEAVQLIHSIAADPAISRFMLVWAIDGTPPELHIRKALSQVHRIIDQMDESDIHELLHRTQLQHSISTTTVSSSSTTTSTTTTTTNTTNDQAIEMATNNDSDSEAIEALLHPDIVPYIRYLAQQRLSSIATARARHNDTQRQKLMHHESTHFEPEHIEDALKISASNTGDWSAFRAQELLRVWYPKYRTTEELQAAGDAEFDRALGTRVCRAAFYAPVALDTLQHLAHQGIVESSALSDVQLLEHVRAAQKRYEDKASAAALMDSSDGEDDIQQPPASPIASSSDSSDTGGISKL